MFHISLAADRKSRSLQPPDTELEAVQRHDFFGRGSEVLDEPSDGKHTLGNFGLELSVAGKHNDRLDATRR